MNNQQLAEKVRNFADELLLQSFVDMAPGLQASNPNHPALVEETENAIEPTSRVLRALELAILTGNHTAEELGWICEDFIGMLNRKNRGER